MSFSNPNIENLFAWRSARWLDVCGIISWHWRKWTYNVNEQFRMRILAWKTVAKVKSLINVITQRFSIQRYSIFAQHASCNVYFNKTSSSPFTKLIHRFMINITRHCAWGKETWKTGSSTHQANLGKRACVMRLPKSAWRLRVETITTRHGILPCSLTVDSSSL